MSDYEQKMLADRENRIIATGIVLVAFAVKLAFILAFFIAYPLGLPFNPVFYTLWAILEIIGIGGIAGGIREKMACRKQEAHKAAQ